SLPVHIAISNRIGKGRLYILGAAWWSAAMLSTRAFVGPATPTIVVLSLFGLAGIGMSAATLVPWALLPSLTDVDELITTERRAGLYAGSMTFVRKSIQALVLAGVGIVLDAIGYMPGAPQSPRTLWWLNNLFTVGPALILVGGAITAIRLK